MPGIGTMCTQLSRFLVSLFNLGEAKTSVLLNCFSINVREIEGVAYASSKKL